MERLLVLLAVCLATCPLLVASEQFEIIQPTENPHMAECKGSAPTEQEGACQSACPALAVLEPSSIISTPIATQPDTLLGIVRKNYMGVEVPIYHFKQPSRLNPNQLPFRLVRMRSLPLEGLVTVPVDPKSAADSWFPGYTWEIVMCMQCDTWKHLGWKFTGNGDAFYALIVDYTEGKRRESEGGERILDALTVGVRAPAWMLALATATLGAQFSGKSQ